MTEADAVVALGLALQGMLLSIKGMAWVWRTMTPLIGQARQSELHARQAQARAEAYRQEAYRLAT